MRLRGEGDEAEFWFRLSPGLREELGGQVDDEELGRRTVRFLLTNRRTRRTVSASSRSGSAGLLALPSGRGSRSVTTATPGGGPPPTRAGAVYYCCTVIRSVAGGDTGDRAVR